jgi:hypothetical protein
MADMVITYRNSESANDARFNYEIQLLELALTKTLDTHGDFRLEPSPTMNWARTFKSAETNGFENLFFLSSYRAEYNASMLYIPIPLQRGVVGYRVFITTPKGQVKLKNIESMEQFKRLKIVQGTGWQDVNILRRNGFRTTTLSNYDSLFQFISHNRADIFPRGVSEYEFELSSKNKDLPNLLLDEKYAFYYPFPRFFYTHKDNTLAYQRIHEGLKRAWKDGSFIALWKKYHQDTIDKANLSQRTIIELDNPEMKLLPEDISQYLYRVK